MAKQTRGKRTERKSELKSKSARSRKQLTAAESNAFPGGSVKTTTEIKRVVPRMTRA